MAPKQWEERWQRIRSLGAGGQGAVWQVRDRAAVGSLKDLYEQLKPMRTMASGVFGTSVEDFIQHEFPRFEDAIRAIARGDDPSTHGALKELHEPEDARDPHRAPERMVREIRAMSEIDHPNLLRILGAAPEEMWYVSEFHPRGTLDKHLGVFKANMEKALRAFRGLVEGVAELHKKGFVHRDIKPQNVFVSQTGDLVLGDFGLVIVLDDGHTRVSGTLSNVGSRDWMPLWAQGKRIEDLKPTFDVFSLGKVLWAMVSGQPNLLAHYFSNPAYPSYDVVNIHPDLPHMRLANKLFAKCIVEYERDCLENAQALLEEVDHALRIVEAGSDILGKEVRRPCRVCGRGKYELMADPDDVMGNLDTFGLSKSTTGSFRVFVCNECGHLETFFFKKIQGHHKRPRAWED